MLQLFLKMYPRSSSGSISADILAENTSILPSPRKSNLPEKSPVLDASLEAYFGRRMRLDIQRASATERAAHPLSSALSRLRVALHRDKRARRPLVSVTSLDLPRLVSAGLGLGRGRGDPHRPASNLQFGARSLATVISWLQPRAGRLRC